MFKNLNLKGFSFKSTFVLVALFIMLFASYNVLCAQAPEWQWVRDAGSTGIDCAKGVKFDADGNMCIIGIFRNSITIGSTILTSKGDYDAFVAKMDADGNWLWAVSAGSAKLVNGKSIAVDDAGNVYVTGSFRDTAYFGSITLTPTTNVYGTKGTTIFVAKLDTDGNWLWAEKAGAWGGDFSDDLVVDFSGNCYVTGGFLWYAIFGADTVFTDDFAKSPTGLPAGGFHYDIFVAKIDTDGNWVWAEQAGSTSGLDEGYAITLDPSGNVCIMGICYNIAYFGSDSLVSSDDLFVAKMDTAGNWLGVVGAEGPGTERGWRLSSDADGNLYITGGFSGTAYFGADSITSFDETDDIFVAKLGANDEWQWARGVVATERGSDRGYAGVTDTDGNYYVTGCFQKEAIFGTTTLTASSDEPGDADGYVAKIDTYGNWLWALGFGTTADNILVQAGMGIALYNGCPYVVGSYQGTVDFGATQLTSAGTEDLFVGKLSFDIITGDFNGDDYVDAADLQMLGDYWFFVDTDLYWNAAYDLKPDGVIDAADLQIFGDHWNEGTPPDLAKEAGSKGSNTEAGIVFDLDATTDGNQNLTEEISPIVGEYLRVDCYAINAHDLDTYQFELLYDSKVLKYIGCSATNPLTYEENILTKNGGEAIGWMVNHSPGVLSIAYTLAGDDTTQAPEGEGLIADVVFQVLKEIGDTLRFGETKYYDTYGEIDIITDKDEAVIESRFSVDEEEETHFEESMLSHYPNPVHNRAMIKYGIKDMLRTEAVDISIYNAKGQLVDMIEGKNGAAIWDTNKHPNGIYFYKINIESYTEVKKMMVTK